MIQKTTKPIERIEKQGENKFRGKTTAKTFEGWLQGKINSFAKKGQTEWEFGLREVLNSYKHYHPNRPSQSKLVKVELKDWKGQGEIYLGKTYENNFIVIEHIKDKDSGNIEKKERIIKVEDVNHLSRLLGQIEISQKLNYKQIVRMIIKSKDLPVTLDAFNGGRNRAEFYFPLYYFPLKILEELKVITYHGRGGVTRLK